MVVSVVIGFCGCAWQVQLWLAVAAVIVSCSCVWQLRFQLAVAVVVASCGCDLQLRLRVAAAVVIGGVGKISEAPRAAHDRMTVLFLQFTCGLRRIHQLIFLLGHLGSPMVFKRGRENIGSAARSARCNGGFVFALCVRVPP